ncbi:HNH endonuclease [Dyella humi]|uniref:HNH endonuclease n=1 Tax=Dyella humi TaxID=1770547 RepID=A0ABW8II59_9GAMM
MMRLENPVRTFVESIDACLAGITGNVELRKALIKSKGDLLTVEPTYLQAALRGELSTITAVDDDADEEAAIVGDLRRSDLIKLYEQYLVPKGKPGRRVYSDLLNAAREQCPFCGGIGTPKTLDHFLTKGKHPSFSVLPFNLVPSCRDCNMGEKGQVGASVAEEVLLQPYADKDLFFNEQWIFSSYEADPSGEPGLLAYFVRTPEWWSAVDVARAEHHFKAFDLAHKYGLKAGRSAVTVMAQARAMIRKGLSHADIREVILQPGIDSAPFSNHWQRGMYQSLCEYFSDGWVWNPGW